MFHVVGFLIILVILKLLLSLLLDDTFVEISPFVGQIASRLLCFTVVVHVVQLINDNMQFHFSFFTVQRKINLVKPRLKICFIKYRYASLHSFGLMFSKSGMILSHS